jgi:ParB family chromosome partitioning protein
MDKPKQYSTGEKGITAKEVQAAIKSGNVTADLLEGEIERIRQREKRSEELDSEKVQLIVHKLLSAHASEATNNTSLTTADMISARLIIYQSLDYNTRQIVQPVLFPEKEGFYRESCEDIYDTLKNLTDQQLSYLTRMAMCSKSESKYPRQDAGYFLYQMAKDAGLPVEQTEEEQTHKAKERKEKMEQKIKELEKKISKLSKQ